MTDYIGPGGPIIAGDDEIVALHVSMVTAKLQTERKREDASGGQRDVDRPPDQDSGITQGFWWLARKLLAASSFEPSQRQPEPPQ